MIAELETPPANPETTGGENVVTVSKRAQRHLRIRDAEWDDFQKKLVALNRKATKFGMPPVEVVSDETVPYKPYTESTEEGTRYGLQRLNPGASAPPGGVVLVRELTIESDPVRLAGWTVAGRLERVGKANLHFVFGDDPQASAQLAQHDDGPIPCDHCQTQRVRNEAFLLRHDEDGSYRIVGSTCLEDFVGIDPAKALFLSHLDTFVKDDFDDDRGGPIASDALPIKGFLEDVAFAVSQYGWVSSQKAKEANEVPTFQKVIDLPRLLEKNSSLRSVYVATQEGRRQLAGDVLDWATQLQPASDFELNMKALLTQSWLPVRRRTYLAIAAAAVPSYRRAQEKRREHSDVERSRSEHVGTPGEARTGLLALDRVITYPTQFGPQNIVLLRDDAGNRLTWKTTAVPSEFFDVSPPRFEGKFKVKGHEVYNNEAQTRITHLKVTRWLESTAENAAGSESADPPHDEDSPAP